MEPQQVKDWWEQGRQYIDTANAFLNDTAGAIDRLMVWVITELPNWAEEPLMLAKGIIALVRGQLGI